MTSSVTRNIIKLHKYESFVYFFLWTNAILYSIYKVSLINTYFDNYNDVYGDFAPGWSWIGKKQDVSDQEWKIWIPLMIKLIPWIFIHHLVSLIIKTVSNITVVEIVNPWALYGLGYCMGQFFLMKYVAVYGLNHTLCAIDNIKAPSQPKCIARIHLYSDMWKYFDKGLYKFLVRYIYVPLLKSNYNKLFASFLCFTFVFVWHGMQINIFIWAALNFIGLNIESVMKSFGRQKYYLSIKKKYLSQINARRFDCILASPLLAVSVISNFYFFAGEEIGNIYVYRLLHDSWSTTFTLLFFLYCCCQVSTDIKNWELQKCQNIL